METRTTRVSVATQPMPQDDDVRSTFAWAPSKPEPKTDDQTSEDRLEAFLRLARAH